MLVNAYDNADVKGIEAAKKSLEQRLKTFAKDIKEKYIDPPNTTDFAIMFLPFEGLYAEILRLPGIFENLQREHKIVVTGPTTISAFLSSLQMGFHSLVVEKRTSEIWELLGAIKTEFGKFGTILQKTKEKLEAAGNEIDNASKRSRAIEKKLKKIQELPKSQSQKILADIESEEHSSEENE
jgi:DNA recombination protein RmuC